MASCRLDFLLLLLLTTHPTPSKAQHWSHGWYPGGKRASVTPWGLQLAPGLPGSPHQTARSLPSGALTPPEDLVPWEGKAVAQPPLRGKQRLVQTLLRPFRRVGRRSPGRRVPWCPAAASGSRRCHGGAPDAVSRRGHAARAEPPGRAAPAPAPCPGVAPHARPQDPPRPASQVQGRTRDDAARGRSCGVLRADRALPGVPPDRARPQGGVCDRGAEEPVRVQSRGPGRAQSPAEGRRAPGDDGLEPGGKPAAARAADGEAAAGGAGAGAAAGGGAGPQGPGDSGLGAAQGAGSAAAAGGGEKLHHPGESGGASRRSFGLTEELQLGYH